MMGSKAGLKPPSAIYLIPATWRWPQPLLSNADRTDSRAVACHSTRLELSPSSLIGREHFLACSSACIYNKHLTTARNYTHTRKNISSHLHILISVLRVLFLPFLYPQDEKSNGGRGGGG